MVFSKMQKVEIRGTFCWSCRARGSSSRDGLLRYPRDLEIDRADVDFVFDLLDLAYRDREVIGSLAAGMVSRGMETIRLWAKGGTPVGRVSRKKMGEFRYEDHPNGPSMMIHPYMDHHGRAV